MRAVGALCLAALAAVAIAYWATHEPAPRIRVLWREGVSAGEQAALERDYSLVNGRDRIAEGSLAYDLLDTSRSNIRRLVGDPRIADTNDLDRDIYRVRDGTDAGLAWTWIGNRLPGLRQGWVRSTALLLLAVGAAWGLRREAWKGIRACGAAAPRVIAAWNAHRHAPGDSRDVFDAIPWRPPARASGGYAGVTARIIALALVLLAAGLPVLETWESLVVGAAALALMLSDARRGGWRLAAAAGLVLAVAGLKAVLPRADIAEAHNAFIVLADGEPLERGLPGPVFRSWKVQFDALYPDPGEPPVAWSWREQKSFPKTLYAPSADALWRRAKYSRQVDTIAFRSLAEFRGGFTSELSNYNFYLGDMAREDMPFYVMYELTPAAVGSRLQWTGQVFWERSAGTFEEIRHDQVGARTIEAEDAGKRVYAAFFAMRDPSLAFELIPSPTLRIAGWAEALLSLLGVVGVVALVARPRWPAYLRAVTMSLVAYMVAVAFFVTPSSARLGELYFPHGGGNDGLVHENHGRVMAMLTRQGQIGEALKGLETVYWFTPGTRYVRWVEKLLFGDTNHLFALALAAIPIVLFYLVRRFVGAMPAWVVVGVFLAVPAGNLSFLQYVMTTRAGYGDGIGTGVFLLGLVLLLAHQPGRAGRRLGPIWAGGAALALSMFMRPNFALAVVWIAALYAWLSWITKDRRAVLAAAAGLALALWMPVHNWYYGGEFFLISRPGQTISLPLGWRDYLAAAQDVAAGRADTAAVGITGAQLKGWLFSEGFSFRPSSAAADWVARLLRVLALAVTAWVAVTCAVGRRAARVDLAFIAGAALWAHVPMLFIFSTYHRYAMLAWDLSMIVLIAWLLRGRKAEAGAGAAALRLQTSSSP